MAVYSVADGAIAVHDKTLSADVVDSVSFANDPKMIEVLTDGAAKIYVTVDGSEPAVGGAKTYMLPAAACKRTISHVGDRPVKLISAGTPTYSITVA